MFSDRLFHRAARHPGSTTEYPRRSDGSAAVRYRHEQKYICSESELAELEIRLGALLSPDPHSGTDGQYRVRSLYFDTYDDRLCRENEDGTSPREKWRIRSYDLCSDRISLERKVHENDLVFKESCLISPDMFEGILCGEYPPIDPENPPVLNRFLVLHLTQMMHPAVIVDYMRRALVFPEGNVRVTLDRGIASCSDPGRYWEKTASFRPVLPAGRELLEVKFDDFLPDPVFNAVQMRDMQRTSFSKYYLSRRYHL